MRLIDADELLKRMCEENCYHECRDSMDRCVWYCYIEDSPTAYDIDKVAEQLEEAKYWTDPHYDEDGYSCDDEEEVILFDDAIEIVKKGGLI